VSVESKHSLRSLPVARDAAPRKRLVWSLSVGAIGVALLSAGLLVVIARPPSGTVTPRPSEPPVLAVVPAFQATRQDGKVVSQEDLVGKVWVANFVFTRCPNICPGLTAKMAGLQSLSLRRLPSLQLVTFTVDPDHDTPEVLRAYGEKHDADFGRWWFLNATADVLENTLSKGMLQPLERGDMKDLDKVMHSSYFALIDKQLRVRGFYRFTEASASEALMQDAEALARTP
jgi:protein SCO1/2